MIAYLSHGGHFLRRLAEMTQQRSFEVTRARNGIRDGTRRIIHAAGVCVDVREIRAISSTPQACGWFHIIRAKGA
jgi:hypothetical protein